MRTKSIPITCDRADRLTTATLTEVDPDELDHVGFEEVDIPPGRLFNLSEGAGIEVEEGACAAIDSLLWDASLRNAGLHRGLASRHVQNWEAENYVKSLLNVCAKCR